jgi:hypothetical protein
VVADTAAVADARGLMSGVSALGARLLLAPVAAGDGTARHDPRRLAAAYRQVLGESPEACALAPTEAPAGTPNGHDGGRKSGGPEWR